MVTEDELNTYLRYINSEIDRLCPAVDGAKLPLWHYTDATGLLGIITSHQLRMTAVDCLNDSTEIAYAEDLYRKAIRRLKKAATCSAEGQAFLKRMLDFIDNYDTMAQDPFEAGDPFEAPYYIACFSERKDDLSQWRAYGGVGGTNSYAIAFVATEPFGAKPMRVNYETQVHEEAADRLAQATVSFFLDGLNNRPGIDANTWYDAFVPVWDMCQYFLAPLVKHESFRVENEYRFIERIFDKEHEKDLGFQVKRSFIARHILVPHYVAESSPRQRLPIVEVMIGPGKHQREAARSVQALLKKHGYTCPVTFSKSPAQRE